MPWLLVCGLLIYLTRSHFIIRQLSDVRYDFEVLTLEAAVKLLPRSGRLNLELAQGLLREKADFAAALEPAQRAVQFSPEETLGWQLLGQAQEGVGQTEAAEKSLRQAVALAPHNSDANWALANLLLRADKIDESIPFYRMAGQLNRSLYPLAFDTLWQVTNKQTRYLRAVSGDQYQAQMALAQFLAEQNLFEDALQLFREVDPQKARLDPVSVQLINVLIQQKQMELARATWLEFAGKEKLTDGEAIWNGGFEAESIRPLSQFDWILNESKYARCVIEPARGRGGSRALKIGFLGKDTTTLSSEVFQVVVLKPGQAYRLEAYTKTANLVTPEGPRLAVKADNRVIATSAPIESGTRDWQRVEVEFVAPKELAEMSVGVIRTPKYAYDEPTSGTLWLDDFSLRELPVNQTKAPK